MIGIRDLPGAAWRQVIRRTIAIIGGSIIASVIISQVIMLTISQGMDGAGLFVSIAMPLLLGTPVLVFVLIGQQQLKLANDELSRLAATDWLTGCLNRRGFTETVSAELQQSGAGVLLVIDADRFKVINDRFGHDQGDEVLGRLAAAIRANLRPQDRLGRLGGEEFSVFLSGADQAAAEITAERIRHAVERLEFSPTGDAHPISVSIGGAVSTPTESFAGLFRRADQRLYDAKRAGRNCVRFGPAGAETVPADAAAA